MKLPMNELLAGRRRVYLVRHAEVSYFSDDGTPQRPDEVPLNADGRDQAKHLHDTFDGVPLDRVVTSDLGRTVETASILLGARDLHIERRAGLNEIRAGKLVDWIGEIGPSPTELAKFFTGTFRRRVRPEDRFLAGESYQEFQDRVLPTFDALLADDGWRHLLVVAHGGANRVILSHTLSSSLDSLGQLEQDAGCINIIDVDEDGGFLVRLMNFTPYEPLKNNLRLTTMESLFHNNLGAFLSLADSELRGAHEPPES